MIVCFQFPSEDLLNLALNIECRSITALMAFFTVSGFVRFVRRTVMLWLKRALPWNSSVVCINKLWIGERLNNSPDFSSCLTAWTMTVEVRASSVIDLLWRILCSVKLSPCLRALEITAIPVMLSPPVES